MVDIAPQSRDLGYVTDDPSWLGSAHGTDSTETITLDGDLFSAGAFPGGRVPSGTPLGKVTATGLYGPYDGNGAGGLDVLVGFLFAGRQVRANTNIGAAALTHGKVREANLPFPVDANGKTDVAGRIRFI